MATVIDALVVTLGLDASDVKKGVSETKSEFSGLAEMAAKALTVIGGAALLRSAINNFLGTADAVGKLSDALGVDLGEMQAWSEAAIRAGGSAEGFQSSVETLTGHLSQLAATGGGRALAFFDELGIKAADSTGAVKPTLDIMRELAARFETMSKQDALGMGRKLGLDRGTIMLLQQGTAGLDAVIKRQKELGVYTKRQAELTAAANDAQADMSQSWRMASAAGLQHIIPMLTALWLALADLGVWFQQNDTFIFAFFITLATIISSIVLPALIKTGAAMLATFAPVIALGVAVAAVAALVAALVDDFLTWAEGGESTFGDLWVEVDKLITQFKALLAAASPLLDFLFALGGALAGVAFDLFLGGIGTIIDAVTSLINILGQLATWIIAVFTGDFDRAAKAGMAILDTFLGFFGRFVDRIKAFWDGVAGKIMAVFNLGKGDSDTQENSGGNGGGGVAPMAPVTSDAIAPASISSSSRSKNIQADTRIEQINVYPPNGDPETIGRGIGSATQQSMNDLVDNFDSGVDL